MKADSSLYRNFQTFLKPYLPQKVQKISLNAGFTCPNRDGSKGHGGCTYCNNQTFNPSYCDSDQSITEQLNKGIRFFAGKYPEMDYLAYFQAYTNTYAELDRLKKLYEEALGVDRVVGLVIGTRPDCMPEELLDYLETLSKRVFVLVEYGIESTDDQSLKRINRGHDFACAQEAVRRTAARNIPVGAHMILGLPLEDNDQIIRHAKRLSQLPLSTIKLHQLQIIRGTRLARDIQQHPDWYQAITPEEYVEKVVLFLEHLNPEIAVERFVSQSPPELLIAPDWGLKNYQFTHLIEKSLRERGSRQGCKFISHEPGVL
ncbi:MAG: TIGR01212 family radical SAM protein [Bacteroidales bacterium]|nr:TIGR01212 family radical SAM protein [Bacteroidales bacterium]MDD3166134.1 TIGR01212 family radical SAM protein [Bacteroidales bacterium]MDD4769848.1 TIGR01212 family radical SAM protein [Bacteroidales bacterium]